MSGVEKVKKLEADVREIKAHLKLAGEKLDKLSENHEISSRMEEDIILQMSGEIERLLDEEVNGLVENFKYHLERQGDIKIKDNGEIEDLVEDSDK